MRYLKKIKLSIQRAIQAEKSKWERLYETDWQYLTCQSEKPLSECSAAQTVDKTPACFPRWGFVLRIKNNKKRLIYAVFWRFCGIMIVTNLK